METKNRCYFILTCARSGSTSLAKILDTAENGICAIEPSPNLNWETREMMEGRLSAPKKLLEETIIPRVTTALTQVEVYGEKNLTYAPFIPYLYEMLGCKFVFLKRDGRDVVRSLLDWHERMFGDIYRECQESGNLSPRAIAAAANLPIHLDTSDYSRPRPLPGDSLHDQWETLTREEMCAYYWSFINDLYLDQLSQIPSNAWITIDYTQPEAQDIVQLANFLGLQGLSLSQVKTMLNSNINSLQDRCAEQDQYPHWHNWNEQLRSRFDKIAANTMIRLGFYAADG